jgi:hypothetical protein
MMLWTPKFLLYFTMLAVLAQSQVRFNAFKSYKDERIKPPHYAKKEVNRHPINEYLTGNQLRMMKHRNSERHHPDAVYKENWSGFDKDRRKLRDALLETEVAQSQPSIFNSEYLRWLCFILVGSSVGWIAYLFASRQYADRKITAAGKDELSISQA